MHRAARWGYDGGMSACVERPNVIVFFTDQQRWDTTGVHGNPLDLTPNFDRMAGAGTHVARSFTCQPVCGPARACLQTGMYGTQTGCFRNGIPLPDDVTTLAQCFNEADYRTGYIGKWHLGDPKVWGPVPMERRGGYQDWLASNTLEFTSHPYETCLYDNDGEAVKLPGYRVDALTDAAIRYVDGHQHDPFFLTVSYIEPHFQNDVDDYPPPDGYRERYDGRWVPPDLSALGGSTHQHLGGYWGMVKRLDEALGRLLNALKSMRLRERTVVLFTTDHGCHFKTRNSEYKRSCHEASIRLPTVLCGPGFDGGGRVNELVSLIDLPPTLLDAAGLAAPDQMAGRSILPLVRGDRDGRPDDVFVQISEAQVGWAVRTARWKYGVDAPDGDAIEDAGSDRYVEQYLYDLQSDPHELRNLAGAASCREIADELKARLLRRMEAAGEAAATIEEAPAWAGGQLRPPDGAVLNDPL